MGDLEEMEPQLMKLLGRIGDHSDSRTVRNIMVNVQSYVDDIIDEIDAEEEEDDKEDK